MIWVAMMAIFHPFLRRGEETGSAHHATRSRVRRWKMMGHLSLLPLASRERVMVPHLHQQVAVMTWVVMRASLGNALLPAHQQVRVLWTYYFIPAFLTNHLFSAPDVGRAGYQRGFPLTPGPSRSMGAARQSERKRYKSADDTVVEEASRIYGDLGNVSRTRAPTGGTPPTGLHHGHHSLWS